jgi:hypothetical protein
VKPSLDLAVPRAISGAKTSRSLVAISGAEQAAPRQTSKLDGETG